MGVMGGLARKDRKALQGWMASKARKDRKALQGWMASKDRKALKESQARKALQGWMASKARKARKALKESPARKARKARKGRTPLSIRGQRALRSFIGTKRLARQSTSSFGLLGRKVLVGESPFPVWMALCSPH